MFIFRREGGVTAKNLAELCNAKCSKFEQNIPKNDFIINYGQHSSNANLNAHVRYNKLSVHKFLMDKDFPLPKIFFKDDEINKKDFPLLARREYHSKGRDIIYLEDENALNKLKSNSYDFLVQYIKKESEYRVHILGDNISFVSVKWSEDEKRDKKIRSKERGWKHIKYNGEFKDELLKLSKKVMKELNYDFGAIDIIRDTHNKLWILEVNSAPGLEERKLKMYSDYFKKEEEKWLNEHKPKRVEPVKIQRVTIEKPKIMKKKESYEDYFYHG